MPNEITSAIRLGIRYIERDKDILILPSGDPSLLPPTLAASR